MQELTGQENMLLPVMNLGKTDIHNVMVSLFVPGVAENQSVLVGTVAPGETKQAQLSVAPVLGTHGEHSGTLTVSYEDPLGKPYEKTMELNLRIEEAPSKDGENQNGEAHLPGWVMPVIIILAVLLLAASAAAGILLQKVHKLEEDRL